MYSKPRAVERRDIFFTSEPSGAEVRVSVTNVGFPGNASFTVKTPYTEEDVPAQFRRGQTTFEQKYDIWVVMDGYKPVHEIHLLRDMPRHIHWILEKSEE